MRKAVMALTLLLLLCSSVAGQGVRFGVGAFGGPDFPVGSDDQAQGTIFGIRGKINVVPIVTFEPRIAFTSFGEPSSDDFVLDLDGSKVKAYGVDAVLGAPFGGKGFAMFGIVGGGFYNVKRDQTFEDQTELGWSAGFGFAIGFSPMISADARGKLNVMPFEDGGALKSVSATVGINYFFGM
jgi:hypothetical protein